MVKLNIHTKSGKVTTLHFHGTKAAEATAIAVRFSDWLSVGDETEAPMVDQPMGGLGRLVIPFSSVEYMEIEA